MSSENWDQYTDFAPLFRTVFTECWDRVAFTCPDGKEFLYSEVANSVVRLHQLLHDMELSPGDRIAILGNNTPYWAIAYIATLTYGAIPIPIHSHLKPRVIYKLLARIQAKCLFVSEEVWDDLNESYLSYLDAVIGLRDWSVFYRAYPAWQGEGVTTTLTEYTKEDIFRHLEKLYRHNPSELFVINFTSGTVSTPKGVLLPSRSLLSNVQYARKLLYLTPGENIITLLPLTHIYSQTFDLLYSFLSGAHIHFLSNGDMSDVAHLTRVFARYKPRLLQMVPQMFELLFKKEMPVWWHAPWLHFLCALPVVGATLKEYLRKRLDRLFGEKFAAINIGGALFNPAIEKFLSFVGFRYSVGYGLTEAGPLVAHSNYKEHVVHSVGKIVNGIEVEIRNKDYYGLGSIYIRGTHLFLEYFGENDSDNPVFDENGWFDTGDLGYLDKNHYLYVKGRQVNTLYLKSGIRVPAEGIESLMNTMPYVQESLLIEQDGELVILVYPAQELYKKKPLSETQLYLQMERNRERVNSYLDQDGVEIAQVQIQYLAFDVTAKHTIRRRSYIPQHTPLKLPTA